MIDPSKDELAGNAGLLFKFLASFGGLSGLKKLVNGLNARGDEFLSVCRADALDVNDFVSHFL